MSLSSTDRILWFSENMELGEILKREDLFGFLRELVWQFEA